MQTTKPMLKEIKIRIEEADLAKLDAEAANAGTNRSAYIRERLVARMTTADYHRIVADACRQFRGDGVPAITIQCICAYALTQAKASN